MATSGKRNEVVNVLLQAMGTPLPCWMELNDTTASALPPWHEKPVPETVML